MKTLLRILILVTFLPFVSQSQALIDYDACSTHAVIACSLNVTTGNLHTNGRVGVLTNQNGTVTPNNTNTVPSTGDAYTAFSNLRATLAAATVRSTSTTMPTILNGAGVYEVWQGQSGGGGGSPIGTPGSGQEPLNQWVILDMNPGGDPEFGGGGPLCFSNLYTSGSYIWNAPLNITAPANSEVIVNIRGDLTVNSLAELQITGGISASKVVFNVHGDLVINNPAQLQGVWMANDIQVNNFGRYYSTLFATQSITVSVPIEDFYFANAPNTLEVLVNRGGTSSFVACSPMSVENRVCNPDFSTVYGTPANLAPHALNNAQRWFQAGGMLPFSSVYATASTNTSSQAPNNNVSPGLGNGNTANNDNYASIMAFGTLAPYIDAPRTQNRNFRSYATQNLALTLNAGKYYYGEFMVKAPSGGNPTGANSGNLGWISHRVNNIGMLVSNGMPTASTTGKFYTGTPQINDAGNGFGPTGVLDLNTWIRVSGSFQAAGNENRITLGRFGTIGAADQAADPHSNYAKSPTNHAENNSAVYAIDRVRLVELPDAGPNNVLACPGSNVILGTQNYTAPTWLNITYQWIPSTGLSAANVLNPTVVIPSNTQYALVVQVQGTTVSCTTTVNVTTASAPAIGNLVVNCTGTGNRQVTMPGAPAGSSYSWTVNGAPFATADPSINTIGVASGTVTVTVTSPGFGCPAVRTISVPGPIAKPTISTPTSFTNFNRQFTASSTSPSVTYAWFRDGNSSALATGATVASTVFNTDGRYLLRYSLLGCTLEVPFWVLGNTGTPNAPTLNTQNLNVTDYVFVLNSTQLTGTITSGIGTKWLVREPLILAGSFTLGVGSEMIFRGDMIDRSQLASTSKLVINTNTTFTASSGVKLRSYNTVSHWTGIEAATSCSISFNGTSANRAEIQNALWGIRYVNGTSTATNIQLNHTKFSNFGIGVETDGQLSTTSHIRDCEFDGGLNNPSYDGFIQSYLGEDQYSMAQHGLFLRNYIPNAGQSLALERNSFSRAISGVQFNNSTYSFGTEVNTFTNIKCAAIGVSDASGPITLRNLNITVPVEDNITYNGLNIAYQVFQYNSQYVGYAFPPPSGAYVNSLFPVTVTNNFVSGNQSAPSTTNICHGFILRGSPSVTVSSCTLQNLTAGLFLNGVGSTSLVIRENQFLRLMRSIYFSEEGTFTQSYINSAPYTIPSLTLRCNTFDPQIVNLVATGVEFGSRYTVTDPIGGTNIQISVIIEPDHPSGNYWPATLGTNRVTLDPNDPNLLTLSSPTGWTSIRNLNTTSPIVYNRFRNEFVGNTIGNTNVFSRDVLLANSTSPPYNSSLHVLGCVGTTPTQSFPLRISVLSSIPGNRSAIGVQKVDNIIRVFGTNDVLSVRNTLGQEVHTSIINKTESSLDISPVCTPQILFITTKSGKTFRVSW